MVVQPDGRRRLFYVVGALVLLGICSLPIDLPLSHAMLDGLMPGEIRAIFRRGEVFGHAYGVLGILITIYVLDPPRRRKLWHLAVCFLAAGLTADLIKLQVWRIRPRPFWEGELTGSTLLGSIWTTYPADWLTHWDHRFQSFPSAHTAVAVAVAYSLSQTYPRGRQWFYVLATLCAMNRIDGGAHFASDVCWGAALGYLIASTLPSADAMHGWISRRRRRPPEAIAAGRPLSRAA